VRRGRSRRPRPPVCWYRPPTPAAGSPLNHGLHVRWSACIMPPCCVRVLDDRSVQCARSLNRFYISIALLHHIVLALFLFIRRWDISHAHSLHCLHCCFRTQCIFSFTCTFAIVLNSVHCYRDFYSYAWFPALRFRSSGAVVPFSNSVVSRHHVTTYTLRSGVGFSYA